VYPSIDYDIHAFDLSKKTQKEPWFLKLNPNGRIPVLVDRVRNYTVFESGAIMLYLQQHYDPDNKFGWDPKANPNEYSELLQWTLFGYSAVGPMQNELQVYRNAQEKIPYAINRYLEETKRVYGVLEIRLSQGRDWLVGPGRGMYSIADINVLPSVHFLSYAGIETLDEWPNVKKWLERARARPASFAGLDIGRP